MTRDKYLAFKIVEQGIFYKTAKIHNDIFNTFVDIVRQKLSTLAGFRQNSTQRKRWSKTRIY